MSFAANLRRIRQEHQMSQPDLATAAKVSKGYIYSLEKGEMENPSIDVLHKLAQALDCTIADLLGEEKTVAKDVEADIPDTLEQFIRQKRRSGDPLTRDDIQSLARTQFRGRRPESVEDWAYLFEFLKRTFSE